jgi:23S rRNA pseudouridine1911/1915/1917 synthase
MLAAGDVRVNGRSATKGTLVRSGDEVTVHALPAAEQRLAPTPAMLAIVYANRHLVAVDKPPAMPSTGGTTAGASVASILLARFPAMARIDATRAAGLVHRLDNGTSGLLIAARHPASYRRLRLEFSRKAVEKDYLAVVRGRVREAGRIARALERRARGRMAPARPGTTSGWHAATDFTPLCYGDGLTLVRLRMRTGVTHQLRVHMALLGHPVLGDRRYGHAIARAAAPEARGWHYLHAAAVRFDAADLPRRLEAPFPAHWEPLFERLGWPENSKALGGG